MNYATSHHGVVTSRNVDEMGIPRRVLQELVSHNKLICIMRGIYYDTKGNIDLLYILQYYYKKSIYDLDASLYLHHYIDYLPKPLTLAFPHGYNTSNINKDLIKPLCVNTIRYDKGIIKIESSNYNYISTYDLPTTLIHCLMRKNNLSSDLIFSLIKRYITEYNYQSLLDAATPLLYYQQTYKYLKKNMLL